MRMFIAALALLCACTAWADEPGPDAGPGPGPVVLAGARYVSHNGSLMLMTPLPNHQIEIAYVRPSPAVWGLVLPGFVVLRGQWRPDGTLLATAFVFAGPPCPPIPYVVVGAVNPTQPGQLVLHGAAPIVDPFTCAVVGQTWASANATLFFMVQGQQ